MPSIFCIACGRSVNEVERLHCFPSSKERSHAWLKSLGMPGDVSSKSFRVCNLHFAETSYQNASSWRLYKEAVPTIQLPLRGDAVKKKEENLKENNIRYKKHDKGFTGQVKKYKWQCSQDIKFVDDTIRLRPRESNIPNIPTEEIIEISITTDSKHDKESEKRQTSRGMEASILPQPPRKKRKVQHEDVDKVLGYLKNKSENRELDGIDDLFLCYAKTFRQFHPTNQALMKVELAKTFAKMELKELKSRKDSSTSELSLASRAYHQL